MDTVITSLVDEMKADRRNQLLEDGTLIEMSRVGKRCGLTMKLAVTQNFFHHFYPYGEDATKGVSWDEIMWDIVKIFKKETSGLVKNGMTFAVMSKTYVKEARSSQEIKTFADGKPRDRRTVVSVYLMADERLQPSLVFGVQDYKFL